MNPVVKNVLVKMIAGDHSEKNVGKAERAFSAASGAMMLMAGMRRMGASPVGALASAAAGSFLLYRGITGHCKVKDVIAKNAAAAERKKKALVINEQVIVNRPRREVYAYWRKLENLPKFMTHLKLVKEYDDVSSHWEARIPAGLGTLEWDAVIVFELESEALAWRSVKDATVENSGDVAFMDAPGGGTMIRVQISYTPPAGPLGLAITSFFDKELETLIREDLQRFKAILETQENSDVQM